MPPKVKVREVLSHDCWVESIWTHPFLPSLPGSRSTALPPMHLLMSFLGAENSTCVFPWDSVLCFSSRKLYQTQKHNVFILFPPRRSSKPLCSAVSASLTFCVSLPSICPSCLPHIRLMIIYLTFAAFPGLCLCYKSMSFLEDNAHVIVPHVAFSLLFIRVAEEWIPLKEGRWKGELDCDERAWNERGRCQLKKWAPPHSPLDRWGEWSWQPSH